MLEDRAVLSVLLGLVTSTIVEHAALTADPVPGRGVNDFRRVAVVCFLKHDYVSGMNKICVYDCLGSDAAITIGAVQLCPLTINR